MTKVISSIRDYAMRGYRVTCFIGDIDLYQIQSQIREEGLMDYSDLNKEQRWLESSDKPYIIGGRDTDVSQIASLLEHRVRELFPINKVPNELVLQLEKLGVACQEAEQTIEATVELITNILLASIKEGN